MQESNQGSTSLAGPPAKVLEDLPISQSNDINTYELIQDHENHEFENFDSSVRCEIKPNNTSKSTAQKMPRSQLAVPEVTYENEEYPSKNTRRGRWN